MSIFSRYIVRAYLAATATCLAAFVSIYLVIDFMERFRKFSSLNASASSITLYFIYKVPEMIYQTAPMAVLMGTILTMGILAKNNEITAMRSSGASLVRIGRPIITTAGLISLSLLFMQEFITPAANEKLRYLYQVEMKKEGEATFFRRDNIWHRDNRYILQARLFTPETATLQGITIWELGRDMNPSSRIDAQSGTPAPGGWQLANVTRRNFLDGSSTRLHTDTVSLDLVADDLKVVAKSAEDMGFTSLRRYCTEIAENGYDPTQYLTLLYSKISLPFAALVMAFLGIPFSLRDGRSGGIGIGIGVSVGIGFAYFTVNALLVALGQAGALNPMLAAWAANMMFAGAGLWFTLTVDA